MIREKFKKAGYPPRFVESAINQFDPRMAVKSVVDDDLIIPNWLLKKAQRLY